MPRIGSTLEGHELRLRRIRAWTDLRGGRRRGRVGMRGISRCKGSAAVVGGKVVGTGRSVCGRMRVDAGGVAFVDRSRPSDDVGVGLA